MLQYMININLPEILEEDFIALIPEQRAHIDTLMSEGIVTSYSLSLDRSQLWVTMVGDSEKRVEKVLRSFPIADYIGYEIIQLAFHNSASVFFPSLSLN